MEGSPTMMDGWNGGMSTGGWVLMGVFWVVVIALLVWAVVILLSRGSGGRERADLAERPEETLDRRLASGEIDTATYDELRTTLRAAHSGRG